MEIKPDAATHEIAVLLADATQHLADAFARIGDDIHATAEYRRTVGAHLVGRAIVNAVDDARA